MHTLECTSEAEKKSVKHGVIPQLVAYDLKLLVLLEVQTLEQPLVQ